MEARESDLDGPRRSTKGSGYPVSTRHRRVSVVYAVTRLPMPDKPDVSDIFFIDHLCLILQLTMNSRRSCEVGAGILGTATQGTKGFCVK